MKKLLDKIKADSAEAIEKEKNDINQKIRAMTHLYKFLSNSADETNRDIVRLSRQKNELDLVTLLILDTKNNDIALLTCSPDRIFTTSDGRFGVNFPEMFEVNGKLEYPKQVTFRWRNVMDIFSPPIPVHPIELV